MRASRGFLLAAPMLWGAIGAGVLIVGMGVALKIQSARLEACQGEFAAFKIQTKMIAESAIAEAKRREAADKKLKEKTDADHKTAVARLNRDIKRLRDDHARRSIVPAAPPASRRPDLACFDRAEFDRAVTGFIGEAAELVGEGAAATVDLDAARAWAAALPR